MHNGVDPRSGERLGPATGDPRAFTSFGQLLDAYRAQLRHFIDVKIAGNNVIDVLRERLGRLVDGQHETAGCATAGRGGP